MHQIKCEGERRIRKGRKRGSFAKLQVYFVCTLDWDPWKSTMLPKWWVQNHFHELQTWNQRGRAVPLLCWLACSRVCTEYFALNLVFPSDRDSFGWIDTSPVPRTSSRKAAIALTWKECWETSGRPGRLCSHVAARVLLRRPNRASMFIVVIVVVRTSSGIYFR